MKKYFALNLLLLAFFTFSCNSDSSDPEPQPDNCVPDNNVAAQLMTKRWVLTAEITLTISGADTTSENTFNKIADCSLDDFLEFKTKNLVTIDNGPDKCVFFMPQTKDGYWCTSNNGQSLIMTMAGLSGEATITSLTATQMQWEEIKPNQPQGKTTIIRSTYTAQ